MHHFRSINSDDWEYTVRTGLLALERNCLCCKNCIVKTSDCLEVRLYTILDSGNVSDEKYTANIY
jgi:hypothetical protein